MKNYRFKINGNEYEVAVNSVEGNIASVSVNGTAYQVEMENSAAAVPQPAVAAPAPAPQVAAASEKPAAVGTGKPVSAPLPGVIISVKVKVGDPVKAGQELAVLEAMKMENSIEATHDGTVTAVHVAKGDSVLEGAPVVSIG